MNFEEQWLHWLRFSKPAADALRRAHNRAVMDEELGIRRVRVFDLDSLPGELGETVVKLSEGKPTVLQTMIQKSDENYERFKDWCKEEG